MTADAPVAMPAGMPAGWRRHLDASDAPVGSGWPRRSQPRTCRCSVSRSAAGSTSARSTQQARWRAGPRSRSWRRSSGSSRSAACRSRRSCTRRGARWRTCRSRWLPYGVAAALHVALMLALLVVAARVGADLLGLPRRWAMLGALAWGPAAAGVASGQNTSVALLLVVLSARWLARTGGGPGGRGNGGGRCPGRVRGGRARVQAAAGGTARRAARSSAGEPSRWSGSRSPWGSSTCSASSRRAATLPGRWTGWRPSRGIRRRGPARQRLAGREPAGAARPLRQPGRAAAPGRGGLRARRRGRGAVPADPAASQHPSTRSRSRVPWAWWSARTRGSTTRRCCCPALGVLAMRATRRGWPWQDRWMFAAAYVVALTWPLGGSSASPRSSRSWSRHRSAAPQRASTSIAAGIDRAARLRQPPAVEACCCRWVAASGTRSSSSRASGTVSASGSGRGCDGECREAVERTTGSSVHPSWAAWLCWKRWASDPEDEARLSELALRAMGDIDGASRLVAPGGARRVQLSGPDPTR